MQLSTRLTARACKLVGPLSVVDDFGVSGSGGSLRTRLVQLQAECPWVVVANSKDMAVHAALLETGQVLYFGGYDVLDTHLYHTDTAAITDIPKFDAEGQRPWTNIFCGGQAWLPDGRLLVAGGMLRELEDAEEGEEQGESEEEQHIHAAGMRGGGERGSWIFDSRRSSWSPTADLNLDPDGNPNSGGRWYPTLVTLHDGRILAVGGHPDRREQYPSPTDERHNNNTPERYSAASGTWELFTAEAAKTQEDGFVIDSYPRVHLLPGGDVFFSTLSKGLNRRFDAQAGTFADDAITPHADNTYAEGSNASSVLLPLLRGDGYRARVLVCGATQAERIDLDASPPIWEQAGGRDWSDVQGGRGGDPPVRAHLCAVLLPTGQVFVTGGTATGGDDGVQQAGAVRLGEVYDPGIDWDSSTYLAGTGTWDVVEQATVRRHYHSSALLLPDGAVWTAGSNGDGTGRELRIELYRPPYLGQVARPRIDESPATVTYRSTFSIRVPGAEAIRRVALLRNGTVTHAFDSDQRYVDLEFAAAGEDLLSVVAPPDPSVAPPGFYMLWVLDLDVIGNPRPCQRARFVHVGAMSVRLTAAGCGLPASISLRDHIVGFEGGEGSSVRRQLLRMLLQCPA
ncbi:MAG: DUF1929 domain-containing protein [Gaiellaceae bacterium MAG52_C11]|nr:DUF1929 domain-containing protein [Candidatus Gaiellasilicea maunaloa]